MKTKTKVKPVAKKKASVKVKTASKKKIAKKNSINPREGWKEKFEKADKKASIKVKKVTKKKVSKKEPVPAYVIHNGRHYLMEEFKNKTVSKGDRTEYLDFDFKRMNWKPKNVKVVKSVKKKTKTKIVDSSYAIEVSYCAQLTKFHLDAVKKATGIVLPLDEKYCELLTSRILEYKFPNKKKK